MNRVWVMRWVIGLCVCSYLASSVSLSFASAKPDSASNSQPCPHRFAVLAFRPKPETLQRWQPLIDYLNQSGIDQCFELKALSYPELEQAVAQKRVDVVLTQPAHYVFMSYQLGLYSPLATLLETENGQALSKFGGVIVRLTSRGDLQHLSNLRGKRIAISKKESLGGYQVQAYELQKLGMDLDKDVTFQKLEMPQDKVVFAVLAGKADAGFVRTGVLEDMAKEGKIDLSRLTVLKAANVPIYPLNLSTPLYPEWALAAMPWFSSELAEKVGIALLSLPQGGEVARQARIHGFTIPGNYRGVDDLMRAIRVPPFDQRPNPWTALWEEDKDTLAAAGVGLLVLLAVLLLRLYWINRRLGQEHRALKSSNSRQAAILNSLGEGVFGIDLQGVCTFANPAALSMLGYTEAEMIGLENHALLHPRRADGNPYPIEECPVYKTLQDGQQRHAEDWLLKKGLADGFPVSLSITPNFDGEVMIGAVAVFSNISERKLMERRLQESEAQANEIVDSAPQGMVVVDQGGRIIRVNAKALEVFGYAPGELDGQTVEILMPEAMRSRHVERRAHYVENTYARPMSYSLGLKGLKKGGAEFDVEVGLSPLQTREGLLIIATVVDITKRKRLENEVLLYQENLETMVKVRTAELVEANAKVASQAEAQARSLAESEVLARLLEMTVSNLPMKDYLQASLEHMLNHLPWLTLLPKGGIFLTSEQGHGHHLHLFAKRALAPPLISLCDQVPFGHCLCGRAAQEQHTQFAACIDHRHEIQYEGIAPHGHFNVPILSGGRVLGVIVFYLPDGYQEIGQEKGYLEKVAHVIGLGISTRYDKARLQEAKEAAEAASKSKSEFLANMSHEIRTPINAVLGFARIGVRDNADPKARENDQRIVDAGHHLLGVINDILDFSKIEAGKFPIDLHPFQLSSVIDLACDFVYDAARKKGIRCTKEDECPDLEEWVLGDALRVQQILVNMLSNAVKFTPEGEVRLRIARDGNTVFFRVVDTGIGMNPDEMNRLFKPFEQADTSTTRRFGGTGLGLAISRELALLMKGDITVESAPGKGSAFTLCLPLPLAIPDDITQATAKATESHARHRLQGLRVLAADDIEFNRMILQDILEHEGATVRFAEDGHDVVKQYAATRADEFDVVLMDILMPGMDGYEATQRILSINPLQPVIGLTAHAMAEQRKECLAAGMMDHLSKPVDPEALVRSIREHVEWNWQEEASLQIMGTEAGAQAISAMDRSVADNEGKAAENQIDQSTLLAKFDGRKAFVAKLLRSVLHQHGGMPTILRQYAERDELAGIAYSAHTMKGVAGNLVAAEVMRLAAKTENAARAEDAAATQLAHALSARVEVLLQELTHLAASLENP